MSRPNRALSRPRRPPLRKRSSTSPKPDQGSVRVGLPAAGDIARADASDDNALTRSPLRIRGVSVILRRHLRMTRKTALRALYAGLEGVGRGVVIKLGICPSVRVGESFAVLLDERQRFQGI